MYLVRHIIYLHEPSTGLPRSPGDGKWNHRIEGALDNGVPLSQERSAKREPSVHVYAPRAGGAGVASKRQRRGCTLLYALRTVGKWGYWIFSPCDYWQDSRRGGALCLFVLGRMKGPVSARHSLQYQGWTSGNVVPALSISL